MQSIRDLARYAHTMGYLRPAQIASRLDLRMRAAVRALDPPAAWRRYQRRAARSGLLMDPNPWNIRGCATAAHRWTRPDLLQATRRTAADEATGTFTFLNDRRALGMPPDWTATGASQLWRYHLQYFNYLPEWLAAGTGLAEITALLTDWIARVRMAERDAADAWHPYVASVRIVNWMLTIAASPPDVVWPLPIVESLQAQTMYVRDNLETDVGGNHLLKNLKALAIAGCFWRGNEATRLRERFGREFVNQLARQLRSDGGHYEQSPMYHVQVLADAIDLALVVKASGLGTIPDLETLIERMAAFLRTVCHPDGDVAQFGDTSLATSPEPRGLVAAVRLALESHPEEGLTPRHALLATRLASTSSSGPPEPSGSAPSSGTAPAWDPNASGFVTLPLPRGSGFLIADAGPVCPDDLPAHAHSDLFGFEVSVDALRLVVDSGVSEYAPGAWRDYFRSTRAHSTVMVDGTEQSDCWASFRVGRRAHVVDAQFEAGLNVIGFSAAHTGFDHLASPVRHRRSILAVAERFWLVVDDLSGSGVHEWTTYLHLHPEVVTAAQNDSLLRAHRAPASLSIGWFGIAAPRCVTGERDPLQGWYAPEFGRVVPAPTLIATGSSTLPVRFGWLLLPGDIPGPVGVWEEPIGGLLIRVGRERYRVMLAAPDGPEARRLNDDPRDAADL